MARISTRSHISSSAPLTRSLRTGKSRTLRRASETKAPQHTARTTFYHTFTMPQTLNISTLTPQGRGAIAVVAVDGANALAALDQCFVPVGSKPLAEILANDMHRDIIYGTWKSTSEDLLIVRTGDSSFEVQCHGSAAAIDAITTDLSAHGSAPIEQPLKAQASWESQPAKSFSAEIYQLMQAAGTERVALRLLEQWSIFPAAVERLLESPNSQQSQQEITSMLAAAEFGLNFHRTRSIVFCGRPNAGKSSLLNRLLGYERAIVDPMAGTTRDVVSEASAIDGWPVEFSDTAGLRNADGTIEKIGIERAMEKISDADVVIGVIDAAEHFASARHSHFGIQITPDVMAINKLELITGDQMEALSQAVAAVWPEAVCVATSAAQGDGIDTLLDTISMKLCEQTPPSGLPFPTTKRQLRWLQERMDGPV